MAKRPKFRLLMDRLAELRPGVIVVFSLDRWARSLIVAAKSFKQMSDLEIGFASVTENEFDLSNPSSGLMLNLLSSFAQYHSASIAQHVRRVLDMKYERGIHRGPAPFGYIPDDRSTRADPLPPAPDENEFPILVELFKRALSGSETCRTLAEWINRQGVFTRNRHKTAIEQRSSRVAQPRRFTASSVQGILTNPFYAGFVVRENRRQRGGLQSAEMRPGRQKAALIPEEFNRVQSILRGYFRAPRSSSSRLRPYLAKGRIRCWNCGEAAWCHHIKGIDYYQESSANRGLTCAAVGRYWPTKIIDAQIERVVKPLSLPPDWKERALALASEENNLIDLERERSSLEARRRRLIELYKDGHLDRAEFGKDMAVVRNRIKSTGPVNIGRARVAVDDFDAFREIWDAATPEEKSELLGRMVDELHVNFMTGQLVEIVPKDAFRLVLESAAIARRPARVADLRELTIGDPEHNPSIRRGTSSRRRSANRGTSRQGSKEGWTHGSGGVASPI